MPIRQRNGIWWIDLRTPGGERIRRSAGTESKKAAQEYHDRVKAELWRQHNLGEAPTRLFDEAAARFLRQHQNQADYDSKLVHIAYWRTVFGGQPLTALTADEITAALPTHKEYKIKGKQPLSTATRNRYLATIRTMLNMCESWKWISRAPKLPDEDEPSVRIRWITHAEASLLLSCISQDWLRDVAALALATGMRAGEVLGLRWGQIDLSRRHAWLDADQTKSSRARSVPLNDDAVSIIRRRIGTHMTHVFSRKGSPIKKVDRRMFATACEKAGIEDFRFHDLRHTWASWHVQAGTPLMVLKELGGWETIAMVQKYAHLGASHLAAHAGAVTFWAQQTKSLGADDKKPPRAAVLSA